MKINNPTKFFAENDSSSTYYSAKKRSTIMTRGDVIKLYAETDSENPTSWHPEPTDSDKWWKMSFDAGQTFPIKMKFEKTSPFATFTVEKSELTLEEVFDGSDNFDHTNVSLQEKTFIIDREDYEILKESGNLNIALNLENGFSKNLSNVKYKFINSSNSLVVSLDPNSVSDRADDIIGLTVSLKTGSAASTVPASPSPVYSMLISAIPTVYDTNYETCNYLDDDISSIECLTKLTGVNIIKLKVVSADPTRTGDISIVLKTKSFTSNPIKIPVTNKEEYVKIELENPIDGTLTIERQFLSLDDTLQDRANDIVISAIITEIKVETI